MKGHPSITRRLVISLIVVQCAMLAATIGGVLTYNLTTSFRNGAPSLDPYSETRARALLAASIWRGSEGSLRIAPTPEFAEYASERPSFRYAALDPSTRAALPGSSPELVKELDFARAEIESARFQIASDPGPHRTGFLRRQETPAGEVILVIYGCAFGSGDLLYHLYLIAEAIFSFTASFIYLPLIAGSTAIAWTVVRHGLKPLGQAVVSAGRIDLDSLDQRLETAHVPTEIMPLVAAVNAALERVDAGVARQRRFIANAAHELRTPVAVLNARIDAPRKPGFEVDIKRDVRRIRNIVEQLLVASRLGERPEEMNQNVDLVDAAQTQIADHTLLAIKGGRQIDFEAPSEPVVVTGSRRAIEAIIANLVDNALRAEPMGGTVTVVVGADASIAVVDHGAGVEEAERELIFEPFWRKNDLTPGTGLGLAIVRELVSLHGGVIAVSKARGGGAKFEVTFPLANRC
ncbi:Adaptive-response+sensory-kinase+SasA [Methylocapsa aurea]|uniref:sensor histidine kinase n=1 Tax=Methylocapsa aurea TaxID=663610 RepID=UPI003D18DBAC